MAADSKNKVLNVPPLRFPEFSGEWERIALGDIGETIIGLTYSPKDVIETGGTIVFRSSNIQGGMIDYSDLVRVSKPIKERIVTKKNDILICARNGSQRLIGKNTLLKESDADNTFGAFMMVYRSDENDIVHPLLSTKRYINQVSENLGARINQITTSDLNSFEFCLPQKSEERRKIGRLFALINERIATQSRIIEDLEQLKSAITQTLYCQNAPNNKLGDIIKQVSTRNRNSDINTVLSVSNRLGFIAQSEQFEDRIVASDDTSNYKIVNNNDFAYNPARINVGSIARLISLERGIVSPMYICFRTTSNVLPEYLEHFFETKYFNNEMKNRLEGSVRLCLSWEGLCNIPIMLPSIDEQKHIGEQMSLLSNKVVLEKQYLEVLKWQKQYLLSTMFI